MLTLDIDDPVLCIYEQQKLFDFELNWFNGIKRLREIYNFTESDGEISEMSRSSGSTLFVRR